MHYGRIYIQYFALWSSHWPGGLIVCVLQQYFGTPPYTVNASAQWDQCSNVKGCQITLAVQKVPFLQKIADLIRDQCIDDLLKNYSDKQQRTQKFQVTRLSFGEHVSVSKRNVFYLSYVAFQL